MLFNIKQAFIYAAKDRDWVKKLAGFPLFMFFITAIIYLVLMGIFFLLIDTGLILALPFFYCISWMFVISIPSAYCTLNANRRIYKPDAPLYELTKNFKTLINTSLIIMLGYILFTAAIIIPITLIYSYWNSFSDLIAVFSVLLVFLYTMALVFFVWVFYLSYAIDLNPSSFYNFKRIKRMLSGRNLGNYFLYIAICFLVHLAFCALNILTYGIGMLFTLPYSLYILSDLQAQFIRETFKKDNKV